MHDMILYLESQPLPQEIILLLGLSNSIPIMTDIFCGLSLQKITICVPTSEMTESIKQELEKAKYNPDCHIPDSITVILFSELTNYSKSISIQNRAEKSRVDLHHTAIVFDYISNIDILTPLFTLSPSYLVGAYNNSHLSSFEIWERSRSRVKHMYLMSIANNGKTEVLSWDYNASNPIELSVIFPMYNVAKYLPQCIESVIDWEADYLEFLFIDDGSPDNCSEIVLEYAKKDSRIHLLKKENGGCASARQYGLEHSQGRYIGFIDPDDYIEPSMYRKLFSRAITGNYEIAYCGYNEYYENTGMTSEVPDALGYPYNEGTCDPTEINNLICYQRVAIWRGIYSKDLISRGKIHFYTDLRRFDDLPFKVEVTSKARSVVAVPEYLYYYRMSRPGQDVSADDERLYVHFPIFEYLDEYITNSSDRRQLDLLQLVKVHTHAYALEKIKNEYFKSYCKQAKKDIRADFSLIEGMYIIQKIGSKKDVLIFTSLYCGCHALTKWLTKHKYRQSPISERTIKKLEVLSKH